VLKAAKMNKEGKSKQEIIDEVESMMKRVKAFILPKTLENLARGGRIGKARSLLASLLDIKPILTLTEDGHIGMFKTTRRWNKAKSTAIESIGEFITGNGDLIVSISDANASEDVVQVEKEIQKIYSPKEIMKVKIGVVVGTHVGTGIGITFYEEDGK
jgi:DegV family protein with EDD domain